MKYGHSDASMTNGRSFKIGALKRSLFGLRDMPPPSSRAATSQRLKARIGLEPGRIGEQISWDQHGQVQILRLEDGTEVALWWDETRMLAREMPH